LKDLGDNQNIAVPPTGASIVHLTAGTWLMRLKGVVFRFYWDRTGPKEQK
jgi:hypothetical protein